MQLKNLFAATLVATSPLLLTACVSTTGSGGKHMATSTIALSFLGRYESGEFDESAAEIVDYDPATMQAFVVNANSGQIDVINASSPSAPTLAQSLDVAADVENAVGSLSPGDLGAANSVAVNNGLVAVAIEADSKQDDGFVAFYTTDGSFVSAVGVGALPDMVTFTPDGTRVLVANEGEPNGDYSVDPDGSVNIIDLGNGAANLTASDVTEIKFGNATQVGPVRISAKSGNDVDADVEPEYIAVSGDSSTAYVFMQENNTVGIIDLTSNTATTLLGLGYKDYSIPGNEFDASNRDNGINIRNWPVFGVYMPDGADSYEFNGTTYLVTANEGDGREYLTDANSASDCTSQGGFDFDEGDCFHYLDEIRIKDIDSSRISEELATRAGFASVAEMQKNENLGRLKVITDLGLSGTCPTIATTGQPDPANANCTYEGLYSYGARSFTIWNTSTGQPVFDSGNDFEVITAQRLGEDFNATNDENGGDDRSDDKGPEPEAVEIGSVNGKTYAFIALERVGGIMVYDISNPETASFVQYINTRDFTSSDLEADLATSPSDLGPEAIKFVSAADSPNGNAMLIVGNEVSGTTAFFQVSVVD